MKKKMNLKLFLCFMGSSRVNRCAIFSGPAGVGKMSAAHLGAEAEGYEVIEMNASYPRSTKNYCRQGSRISLGIVISLGFWRSVSRLSQGSGTAAGRNLDIINMYIDCDGALVNNRRKRNRKSRKLVSKFLSSFKPRMSGSAMNKQNSVRSLPSWIGSGSILG
jgi:hypothetical protein